MALVVGSSTPTIKTTKSGVMISLGRSRPEAVRVIGSNVVKDLMLLLPRRRKATAAEKRKYRKENGDNVAFCCGQGPCECGIGDD